MSAITNPPSLITFGPVRFLIVDSPSDANIEAYIKLFKSNGVTDVVRACESTYAIARLEAAGVHVHVSALPPALPCPAPLTFILLPWCDVALGSVRPVCCLPPLACWPADLTPFQ